MGLMDFTIVLKGNAIVKYITINLAVIIRMMTVITSIVNISVIIVIIPVIVIVIATVD